MSYCQVYLNYLLTNIGIMIETLINNFDMIGYFLIMKNQDIFILACITYFQLKFLQEDARRVSW